jgi:hypothetical protein
MWAPEDQIDLISSSAGEGSSIQASWRPSRLMYSIAWLGDEWAVCLLWWELAGGRSDSEQAQVSACHACMQRATPSAPSKLRERERGSLGLSGGCLLQGISELTWGARPFARQMSRTKKEGAEQAKRPAAHIYHPPASSLLPSPLPLQHLALSFRAHLTRPHCRISLRRHHRVSKHAFAAAHVSPPPACASGLDVMRMRSAG